MVMFIKEHLLIILLLVMVLESMQTVTAMKVIGQMVITMVEVFTLGVLVNGMVTLMMVNG